MLIHCFGRDGFHYACTQHTQTKLYWPISLSTVKRHLRIDNDFKEDDAYLVNLSKVAIELAENYIEKSIALTEDILRIDQFMGNTIKIHAGNYVKLISVKNEKDEDVGDLYQITKGINFFQIAWKQIIQAESLFITFQTGYEEEDIPPVINQAILIKIADLYDAQRSDINWSGLQDQKVFEALLQHYKMIQF